MAHRPAAHLAQLNIATLRQPLDHPDSADFVNGLDPVNHAGETSPGFVWRLKDDTGSATSVQVFPNPLTIVNLTVWESIEALRDFAYRGIHRDFFRRSSEWFTADGSATALWHTPAGVLPDEHEAKRRLEFLQRFGPSPYAFAMGQKQRTVTIERTGVDDADALALIGELNDELAAMYPEPGANHFRLDPDEVRGDRGSFVLARLDDRPVACGAFRRLDERSAEIKRMYVRPDARGLKLGAAVLWDLESRALAAGISEMRLETGPRQAEALGLYERFGYAAIPCWGEYLQSPDSSLCMGRSLATS